MDTKYEEYFKEKLKSKATLREKAIIRKIIEENSERPNFQNNLLRSFNSESLDSKRFKSDSKQSNNDVLSFNTTSSNRSGVLNTQLISKLVEKKEFIYGTRLNFNNYDFYINRLNILNISIQNQKIPINNNFNMCNNFEYVYNEIYSILNENLNKIILIQSHIKRYLVKKKVDEIFLNFFYDKANMSILIVQKNIRNFLMKIKIRKYIILKMIMEQRKEAFNFLIKIFKKYYIKNLMIEILKLKEKIKILKSSCLKIQKKFRNYNYYRKFRIILNNIRNNYYLTYPFLARKVKIKIYLYQFLIYEGEFEYNKILKMFIIYISPNKLKPGKYQCQFIVDNNVVCDTRYGHVELPEDNYYNIIDFSLNRKNTDSKTSDSNINNVLEVIKEEYESYSYTNNKDDFDKGSPRNRIHECNSSGNNNFLILNKISNDTNNNNNDVGFSEEEYMKIKLLRNKDNNNNEDNLINEKANIAKLRDDLINKKFVNKTEIIKKSPINSFKYNY